MSDFGLSLRNVKRKLPKTCSLFLIGFLLFALWFPRRLEYLHFFSLFFIIEKKKNEEDFFSVFFFFYLIAFILLVNRSEKCQKSRGQY